jgi:hypothetical protein
MTRLSVAADHAFCVKCGWPACPMGRDPDQGTLWQHRQFDCVKCNGSTGRRATLPDRADPMREPAVQGWLNSRLLPPN